MNATRIAVKPLNPRSPDTKYTGLDPHGVCNPQTIAPANSVLPFRGTIISTAKKTHVKCWWLT